MTTRLMTLFAMIIVTAKNRPSINMRVLEVEVVALVLTLCIGAGDVAAMRNGEDATRSIDLRLLLTKLESLHAK